MALAAKSASRAGTRPIRKQRLRLWLRLLLARRAIEAELRERLRVQFDLTLPQFDVMAALARNPDGMMMTSLSQALMVSNGNVTGIIDRLIAKNYVVRRALAEDRRRLIVWLTPEGAEQFSIVARLHEGWVDELLSGIGLDQAEAMLTKFERLAGNAPHSGAPAAE